MSIGEKACTPLFCLKLTMITCVTPFILASTFLLNEKKTKPNEQGEILLSFKSTVSWPWQVQDLTDNTCITLPWELTQRYPSELQESFRNGWRGIRKDIAVSNSRIQRIFNSFCSGPVFQQSTVIYIHICRCMYRYARVYIDISCVCSYIC